MTFSECLQVEQRGPVRWIRLNRSRQRNALNESLIDALTAQVHAANDDPNTRVVAVAGNGPSFCAGGDFRQFLDLDEAGRNPVEFLIKVSDCFTQIEASPKPWVAVLHGHVVAGGLELALACDVVIAAETALIGDGHLNNQLLPAGGSSVRLPKAVGQGLSRWLLLTGDLMPAARFADAGWILEVVPDDILESTADTLCNRLSRASGPAQRALKDHLRQISDASAEAGLKQELDAFAANWDTGQPGEALRKFLHTRAIKKDAS